jgi:hypothetical protein
MLQKFQYFEILDHGLHTQTGGIVIDYACSGHTLLEEC